MMIGGWTVFI